MARRDAPGRKVGTIAFRPRHLASNKRERVELRLDESSGLMHATAYGTACCAKSLEELRKALEEASDHAVELTWTRVIDVDYKAHDDTGTLLGLDPEDSDRADWHYDRVSTVELSWNVYDVSSPYGSFTESLRWRGSAERGATYQRANWIECELDDDGRYVRKEGDHYDHAKDWEGWAPGIVLYTDERITVLRNIQAGLAGVDRMMRALFEGNPNHIARALDRALSGGTRLLLGEGDKIEKAAKAAGRSVAKIRGRR